MMRTRSHPHMQKTGGYGGVACMVRRDLDVRYKFHLNGGTQITILEVQTEYYWCIYACMLHYKKQDFQEILDVIQEIILTFRSSHVLFLVGDINFSLIERLGNDRDKLLNCFIYENSLLHSQDGSCTYIHSKDSSSSEIDYIFYSEDGATWWTRWMCYLTT